MDEVHFPCVAEEKNGERRGRNQSINCCIGRSNRCNGSPQHGCPQSTAVAGGDRRGKKGSKRSNCRGTRWRDWSVVFTQKRRFVAISRTSLATSVMSKYIPRSYLRCGAQTVHLVSPTEIPTSRKTSAWEHCRKCHAAARRMECPPTICMIVQVPLGRESVHYDCKQRRSRIAKLDATWRSSRLSSS